MLGLMDTFRKMASREVRVCYRVICHYPCTPRSLILKDRSLCTFQQWNTYPLTTLCLPIHLPLQIFWKIPIKTWFSRLALCLSVWPTPIVEICTRTYTNQCSILMLGPHWSSFGKFLKIETNFPWLEASRGSELKVCFEDMVEEFPFGFLVPKK